MWGPKVGHPAKSAENLVNTLAVTFFKQSSWILLKLFVLIISRLVWNWVTCDQKLGHQAKSKGNLVNTLAVTILKQSSWILLKANWSGSALFAKAGFIRVQQDKG